LRKQLQARGAGGWKDTEDLRLGVDAEHEIRIAIRHRTGGFIWWGTRVALKSDVINRVELPEALARSQRESGYPLVPVFVDLSPTRDIAAIDSALTEEHSASLSARNGLVRSKQESQAHLIEKLAVRYVADAIRGLKDGAITAMITAFRASEGDHDLTLDWRHLFDPASRTFAPGGFALVRDALARLRDALQVRSRNPVVQLELDLPLPLALFVGYEWRLTSGIRLEVHQPREQEVEIVRVGEKSQWSCPDMTLHMRSGLGPCIVAVAIGDSLHDAAERYAAQVDGSELHELHVPGLVGAKELQAVAEPVAQLLRRLNDNGKEKHLLMRGPVSLGLVIGASLNGTGRTVVPFWDGTNYVHPITLNGWSGSAG
jgi:hypothetical protein